MLNNKTFAENMALLGEIYDKPLNKMLLKVYYAILKDMQDEDFKQAIKRLLSERVYPTFPKPAEILELSNVEKIVIVEIDELEEQAKELIQWCETANATIFENAKMSGRTFDDEIKGTKFTSLSDSDLSVLNAVKPYCNHKQLIGNIRTYQTSREAINAFKSALKYAPTDLLQIGDALDNLRIKR